MGAPTGRRTRPPTPTREFAADAARGPGRDRRRTGRSWPACRWARATAVLLRRSSTPSAVLGHRLDRRRNRRAAIGRPARPTWPRTTTSRSRATRTTTTGGAATTPISGDATGPPSRTGSSDPDASPSRTRASRSRTGSPGPSRRIRRRSSRLAARRTCGARPTGRCRPRPRAAGDRLPAPGALPGPRHPRRRTTGSSRSRRPPRIAGRAIGGRLVGGPAGGGHLPTFASRSSSTGRSATSSSASRGIPARVAASRPIPLSRPLRPPSTDGGRRPSCRPGAGCPPARTASGSPRTIVRARASTTVVLLPSAPIIHSRQWKGQIHYLSRLCRVVTYDGRGNGRSDRPTDPAAYADDRSVRGRSSRGDGGDRDAAGRPRRALRRRRLARRSGSPPSNRNGSSGSWPSRSGVPLLSPPQPHYAAAGATFDERAADQRGLGEDEPPPLAARLRRTSPAFFFAQMTTEPHSTKAIEDAAGWATRRLRGRHARRRARTTFAFDLATRSSRICRAVRCPMLLRPRTEDRCQPIARAARLAELTRRTAGHRRGRQPHDPRAPPGAGQSPDPRLHPDNRARSRPMTITAHGRWTRSLPATARPLPLVADRTRPRDARRGHRRRAAPPPPGPRDRVARPGRR